jgi:hypothetical protein
VRVLFRVLVVSLPAAETMTVVVDLSVTVTVLASGVNVLPTSIVTSDVLVETVGGSVTVAAMVIIDFAVVVFETTSGVMIRVTVALTVEVLSMGLIVANTVVVEVDTISTVVVISAETEVARVLAVVGVALEATVELTPVPGTKGVPFT